MIAPPKGSSTRQLEPGQARTEAGLIVPGHAIQKNEVRWTKGKFRHVARAAKFLKEQDIQMAMHCSRCQSMIKGTIDMKTRDRVWECGCTIRRVEIDNE